MNKKPGRVTCRANVCSLNIRGVALARAVLQITPASGATVVLIVALGLSLKDEDRGPFAAFSTDFFGNSRTSFFYER